MRIPFFFRRRKSKEDSAKGKTSRMCCLHSSTETTLKLPTPKSDITTVVRGASISSSTVSSTSNSAFHIRQNSISRINTNAASEKTSPTSPPMAPTAVRSLDLQFAATRSSSSGMDTEEAVSPQSRFDSELTPSTVRTIGRKSPRKGPGLGSVDDSPPTRMSREKPAADLVTLVRPACRRDNATGAQAPQLPTRLEVCVDRNRGRNAYQPILTDSAISMNSDKSIGSHPLTESVSPRRSVSPLPRSRSPVVTMHRTRSPYEMNIYTGSTKSRSPAPSSRRSLGPSSRRSSDSRPEEINNQPTKLSLQTKWDWDEHGIIAPCEMEMHPTTGLEVRAAPNVVRNAIPRLHRWHIHLKLDWVSESSNDLVAEVCLTDSRTPPASSNNESSEGSCSSEITPDESPERNERQSRRQPRKLYSVDTAKNNQTNVIHIVDRVLAELQKQKRSARNKERVREAFDQRSPNSLRMHGRQTPEQNDFFRLGASPEVYSPVQRLQRRQEVLQAFEVLITKMESRFTATEYSEQSLMEAVVCDLRDEVSRLESELGNRGSSSENNTWTTALSNCMPFKSARSHKHRNSEDDFPGFSVHGQDSKAKRIHSVPISSSMFPVTFPETSPIERSVSCFTELQSAPLSILDSYVPSRRDGTKERLAKIAMFNEEMLQMNGSNSLEAGLT